MTGNGFRRVRRPAPGRRVLALSLAVSLCAALPTPARDAEGTGTLLARARVLRDSLAGAADTATGLHGQELALLLGRPQPPLNSLAPRDQREGLALRRWDALQRARYDEAAPWIDTLAASLEAGEPFPPPGAGPLERLAAAQALTLREDFRFVAGFMATSSTTPADRIALGGLALRTHDPARAESLYAAALSVLSDPVLVSEAACGLARARRALRRDEEALAALEGALDRGVLSADLLCESARTLVRLQRVGEAVSLFRFTLELNRRHERAHYYLGNGFTRHNYSELERRCPGAFPDSAAGAVLRELSARIFDPDPALEDSLRALLAAHPGWVEPRAMLAERAWLAGDLPAAEALCDSALALCPGYGRAHAILARAFERARMRLSRHYASDEAAFNAAEMPRIEGIERYVANWSALPARYRKRLALSLQPWAGFIPVLAEVGATHTVKPLHMRLSRVPGLETLRDQRISYDSRLWDDVRGVGGRHTVTGVEDVERSIHGGYNTVLHELTHQVHGLFPDEEKEKIETVYRRARAREAAGDTVFLSRYQAASVWEYFAEGANAYSTPRRDAWDPREIVRERLFARDTALVALVEEFRSRVDMAPYLAVGRVNAAYEMLEEGRADSAWTLLQAIPTGRADTRAALRARAYVSSILDRDDEAIALARRGVKLYPDDAASYTLLGEVLRHARPTARPSLAALQEGLAREEITDEPALLTALGDLYHELGWYGTALSAYEIALAEHAGSPEALWGLGVSWGDSSITVGGDPALLDSSLACLEQALRARGGVLALRLDAARIRLQHGDLPGADGQIREAEALAPDDPLTLTLRAWWLAASGRRGEAGALVVDALKSRPIPDLTRVLAALLGVPGGESPARLAGKVGLITPEYRFNPRRHAYESYGLFPAWQRRLLEKGVSPAGTE